jgi:hypothetical protein
MGRSGAGWAGTGQAGTSQVGTGRDGDGSVRDGSIWDKLGRNRSVAKKVAADPPFYWFLYLFRSI